MISMDNSLIKLYRDGVISRENDDSLQQQQRVNGKETGQVAAGPAGGPGKTNWESCRNKTQVFQIY